MNAGRSFNLYTERVIGKKESITQIKEYVISKTKEIYKTWVNILLVSYFVGMGKNQIIFLVGYF